jgi:hypothetical protein
VLFCGLGNHVDLCGFEMMAIGALGASKSRVMLVTAGMITSSSRERAQGPRLSQAWEPREQTQTKPRARLARNSRWNGRIVRAPETGPPFNRFGSRQGPRRPLTTLLKEVFLQFTLVAIFTIAPKHVFRLT